MGFFNKKTRWCLVVKTPSGCQYNPMVMGKWWIPCYFSLQIRIPHKNDPDRVVYALEQEDWFWTEIVREIGPESETLSYALKTSIRNRQKKGSLQDVATGVSVETFVQTNLRPFPLERAGSISPHTVFFDFVAYRCKCCKAWLQVATVETDI